MNSNNPHNTNNFFLFYYFRQTFPQSQAFHIFHFLIRSIGLLLCTSDISNNEKSNFSINVILSQFTFVNSHLIKFNMYFIASAVIFSFFMLILIFFIVIHVVLIYLFKKNHSVFVYQYANHSFKFPKKIKVILKIYSSILIITSVLNQHLLDFLFFGVMNLYYKPNLQQLPNIKTEFISNFNSKAKSNSYIFLGVMNVITCFIILASNFLLNYLFNSKSLCSSLGNINYSENIISNSVYAYFSFLQAIYSTINIYNDDHQKIPMFYITLSIVVLLLIHELIMWNTFLFLNPFSIIKRFIQLFCIFSGIAECILYFIIKNPMTQKESTTKLCFIVLLTLVVLSAICLLKYYFYENQLVLNLFKDTKPKQYETLLYLFSNLRNILQCYSKKAIISLFLILQKHKRICNRVECPCNELDITKLNNAKGDRSDNEEMKEIIFNYFIIILEHEVVSSLHKLKSSFENYSMQVSLIFLHLDLISLLRNNYRMAYYYAGIYASMEENKLSSMHLYYLYELKFQFLKTLLKTHIEGKKLIKSYKPYSSSNDSNSIKQYKRTKKLKEKYEYLISQETIKGIMMKCIEIILNIISYRKFDIHSKSSTEKCEDLIIMLNKYKKMNRMLKDITESVSSVYKLIQMKQMAYLLYHYFTIMNIPIPYYMSQSINSISSYTNNDIGDISFDEINMRNPLIAQMKSNDSFEINYISQSICDVLHYKKSEIIKNDINVLLPQVFNEAHQMYLKLFVLFGDGKYSKNSFIKTKKDNLIHCHIICKSLPSYSEFYLLLVNFHFIPSVTPNKINYYVIIDKEFQFLHSNQEFNDHFFLTSPMVSMLNINLINLFCLNEDQIAFTKVKISINDKDNGNDNDVNILEEMKAIRCFTSIKSNSFLKYFNYKYFIQILAKSQDIIKKISVKKKALFSPIDKIIQNVSEMNLNYEFLTRMTSLQERIKQSMKRHSKFPNSDCNSNKYDITLTYRSLGKCPYCVVLIEEDNVDPFHLIHIIKKFKASTDSEMHYIHKNSITNSRTTHNKSNSKDITQNSMYNSSLRITNLNSTSSKREILSHYNNKTNESSLNNTKQNSTLLLKSTENISTLFDQNYRKRINYKTMAANEKELSVLSISTNSWYNSKKLINFLKKTFLSILIVLIILNLYSLIEDSKQINISRYIALLNNHSFLLKGQMIFSSLFFIRTCCVIDGILKEDINRTDKLKDNGNLLMNLLILIQTDINNCNLKEVKELYQILTENTTFKAIDIKTATVVNTQSTLVDQIISIHYYFSKLYYAEKLNSCGTLEYFKRKANIDIADEGSKSMNLEKLLLPYFLFNSYGGIVEQLNKLTKRTNEILIAYHKEIKLHVGMINAIILSADFILLIVFLTLILINSKIIKGFLLYFITNTTQDNCIDEKMSALNQLVNEFNASSFKSFQNALIKKQPPTFITQKKQSFLITIPTSKRSSIERDKSNHRSSMLNVPIHKINNKLFKPSFVTIGVIIIIIIYICLLTFQAYNIFLNIDIYDQILHLNIINSNFLQRIPSLHQLALFYLISIVLNNPMLLIKKDNDYEDSLFSNFYKINIDHHNDSFYVKVGESYYGYLNYQLNVIRANINELIKDKDKKNNFKLMLQWEFILNEKNNFPIFTSLAYNKMNPHLCPTIVKCFENQNKMLKDFMVPGNGMNRNGINIVLDTTMQLFNTYYLQFIDDTKGNDIVYINEKDVSDSLMNIIDIFKVLNIYMNTFITSDMNSTYYKMKQIKICFSLLSIILNVLLASLSYLLVVRRIEKDKNTLLTVGKGVLLIISGNKGIENNSKIL